VKRVIIALLLIATPVSAGMLPKDGYQNVINAAQRKKVWQQVPFALSAASKVIRLNGTPQGGEVDYRNTLGIIIRPSANLTAWYDSDTTKTWTIEGGAETVITLDSAATLTINGTAAVIELGAF